MKLFSKKDYLYSIIKNYINNGTKKNISVLNPFGPIKDVKLDNIKPFTFFIGESGSGKSTILKVLL